MDTKSRVIGNHVDFFRDGDSFASPLIASVSRARSSNVATIVSAVHGYTTGDVVNLTLFGDASYNAVGKVVTVLSSTSFTYASTGTDESTAADTAGRSAKTGTSSRNVLPDDTDANWIGFGVVSSLDVEKKQTEEEIFAPNPGRLERYDVIETKRVLGYDFTAEELTPFAFEVLFGTASLTSSSTTYAQLAGATKKGFIRIKQYDQDNALFNTVHAYGYLKVSGKVSFSEKHVTVPFTFEQLVSTKNAGLIVASS